MCGGGGGKADDRAQKQQLAAAREARQRENARQARIESGQEYLDALFEGGTAKAPLTVQETEIGAGLKPRPAPATTPATPPAAVPEPTIRDRLFAPAASTPTGVPDYEHYEAPGRQSFTFEGYSPYVAAQRQAMHDYYTPQLTDQFGGAQRSLTFGLARSGQSASSEGVRGFADLTNAFDQRQVELGSRIDTDANALRGRFEGTRASLEAMLRDTGDAQRVANRGLAEIQQLYTEKPEVSPLGDVFANLISAYGTYGQGVQQGRLAGIYDTPGRSYVSSPIRGPSGRVIQ